MKARLPHWISSHNRLAVAAADNVCDVDCSPFLPASIGGMSIHGAYFENDAVIELMRQILRGIDRSVLLRAGTAPTATPQPV